MFKFLCICNDTSQSISYALHFVQVSLRNAIVEFITNISPRKLTYTPQMRKSNGHLSNKNVLSNFLKEFLLREESFNLAGRSFQIVGPRHALWLNVPVVSCRIYHVVVHHIAQPLHLRIIILTSIFFKD